MEKIEVNGIEYVYQEPEKRKVSKSGMRSMSLLSPFMMALPYFDPFSPQPKREKQRPSVNLAEEFKLIQEKKSKLSKSNRDWVVSQFHRYFKPVANIPH